MQQRYTAKQILSVMCERKKKERKKAFRGTKTAVFGRVAENLLHFPAKSRRRGRTPGRRVGLDGGCCRIKRRQRKPRKPLGCWNGVGVATGTALRGEGGCVTPAQARESALQRDPARSL